MLQSARQATRKLLLREWTDARDSFWEIWRFLRTHNWKDTARYLGRRKFWPWWALLAFVVAAGVVLSSYHNQIVEGMRPYAQNIKHSKYAWVIPVILLILVSFPPLFGHEIILLVCGMAFGLWRSFAIACGGTFLGELACYYAFKYLFRSRAAKLEKKHVLYACIAQLMREGGLKMLVLVRFSAMPGHVVTAMQSTIGIGVWKYAVAAFLTLEKQFSICYIGDVYGKTGKQVDPTKRPNDQTGEPLSTFYAHKQTQISLIVFAVTTLATLIAFYIVWQKARRIRPRVLAQMEEERKALAAELQLPTLCNGLGNQSGRNSLHLGTVSKDCEMGDDVPEDVPYAQDFPDAESAKRRPTFNQKDSTINLLGSPWSIHTPTFEPRSRSDTIERLHLDASPSDMYASSSTSRSRSDTISSLQRTPSLPHLPRYHEVVPVATEDEEREGSMYESLSNRRWSLL